MEINEFLDIENDYKRALEGRNGGLMRPPTIFDRRDMVVKAGGLNAQFTLRWILGSVFNSVTEFYKYNDNVRKMEEIPSFIRSDFALFGLDILTDDANDRDKSRIDFTVRACCIGLIGSVLRYYPSLIDTKNQVEGPEPNENPSVVDKKNDSLNSFVWEESYETTKGEFKSFLDRKPGDTIVNTAINVYPYYFLYCLLNDFTVAVNYFRKTGKLTTPAKVLEFFKLFCNHKTYLVQHYNNYLSLVNFDGVDQNANRFLSQWKPFGSKASRFDLYEAWVLNLVFKGDFKPEKRRNPKDDPMTYSLFLYFVRTNQTVKSTEEIKKIIDNVEDMTIDFGKTDERFVFSRKGYFYALAKKLEEMTITGDGPVKIALEEAKVGATRKFDQMTSTKWETFSIASRYDTVIPENDNNKRKRVEIDVVDNEKLFEMFEGYKREISELKLIITTSKKKKRSGIKVGSETTNNSEESGDGVDEKSKRKGKSGDGDVITALPTDEAKQIIKQPKFTEKSKTATIKLGTIGDKAFAEMVGKLKEYEELGVFDKIRTQREKDGNFALDINEYSGITDTRATILPSQVTDMERFMERYKPVNKAPYAITKTYKPLKNQFLLAYVIMYTFLPKVPTIPFSDWKYEEYSKKGEVGEFKKEVNRWNWIQKLAHHLGVDKLINEVYTQERIVDRFTEEIKEDPRERLDQALEILNGRMKIRTNWKPKKLTLDSIIVMPVDSVMIENVYLIYSKASDNPIALKWETFYESGGFDDLTDRGPFKSVDEKKFFKLLMILRDGKLYQKSEPKPTKEPTVDAPTTISTTPLKKKGGVDPKPIINLEDDEELIVPLLPRAKVPYIPNNGEGALDDTCCELGGGVVKRSCGSSTPLIITNQVINDDTIKEINATKSYKLILKNCSVASTTSRKISNPYISMIILKDMNLLDVEFIELSKSSLLHVKLIIKRCQIDRPIDFHKLETLCLSHTEILDGKTSLVIAPFVKSLFVNGDYNCILLMRNYSSKLVNLSLYDMSPKYVWIAVNELGKLAVAKSLFSLDIGYNDDNDGIIRKQLDLSPFKNLYVLTIELFNDDLIDTTVMTSKIHHVIVRSDNERSEISNSADYLAKISRGFVIQSTDVSCDG